MTLSVSPLDTISDGALFDSQKLCFGATPPKISVTEPSSRGSKSTYIMRRLTGTKPFPADLGTPPPYAGNITQPKRNDNSVRHQISNVKRKPKN